jgi:hypothetical protein
LYIKEKEIYIRIFEKEEHSDFDRRYMANRNSLGLFEENFEIVKSEIDLLFENARIFKSISLSGKGSNKYFTIFLTNICLIRPNIHKEDINEGKAVLNPNGLKIVNLFYSFFTNLRTKNSFDVSRMNGMSDYYKINNLKFRPELDYSDNEQRNSEEFTVKKIPTIRFSFKDTAYEEAKDQMAVICKFLSFCYRIRIQYHKLIYRTEESIYIYFKNEKINEVYTSKIDTIFEFLSTTYRIEKILKTKWYLHYLNNRSKFDKAIDNYLHSREVESSSRYLLLFNIIEIFNQSQAEEKF